MKIYIAGVGVGMGPIACIARDMGHEVVLSDRSGSDVCDYMKSLGFTVYIGQDGSQIDEENQTKPIDWFIYTAALKDDHPELTYARQNNIRTSKRDDFFNEMLESKNLKMLAISGTHGKTNTTAMTTWALMQTGTPISYAIGTIVPFGPFGKYEEGSKYFVYEADEFDRNMLKYQPDVAVITNVAFDHPDTYKDEADYKKAFDEFIASARSSYVYSDDYDGSNPAVSVLQKDPNEASVQMPGIYIRQNARLVVEMLVNEFGLDRKEVIKHLNSYPGVARRMEKLKDGLYTDYAHHPEEIAATIQAAKELSDNVVVVYQPHQNIRQHEIIDQYGNCFDGAKQVYWLPTYLSRENDLPVLSPEDIISHLPTSDNIEATEMNDELAKKVTNHLESGDMVIGMAAGDLDHWLRQTEF